MRRKILRLIIVTALCVPVFVFARGAGGIGAADFSGWDMGAKATAVQFVFDSPSLGIPAHPTGELNLAFSEASLQSGPAAYGLGSSLWPGQVVAALPPFLQKEIETQAGQEFFPVDLPAYPVRAESFYPQGPTSASLDAGTVHMRSSAKETASEGISYLNKFEIPFVGSMGNQSSFAQNGFDVQGAVSMVEASSTDISLLSGLIRIDSVVTRAAARSDGEKGTVAGTTTIAGARVQGIGDVVIDTKGVHVFGQGIGAAAGQQALNEVLNRLGISIQLSAPVDTITGPKASRSLGGLVISIKSSTLEPVIAALPEQLQKEIRGQITFDQTIAVQIAPAVVTAGAVKNIPFEEIPEVAPPVAPTDTTDGGTVGRTPDTAGTGAAPSDTTGAPTSVAGTVVAAPVRTDFQGVPMWMVVLLMIAAFVSSRPLTALADRALSARPGGGECPDAS